MSSDFRFSINSLDGTCEENIRIDNLVIAGWTGRDREALEEHIAELGELGIPRPETTPVYYRVSVSRLTQSPRIEVSGTQSSGEAEFVLLQHAGCLYVGVASDHTDRNVETYNITVSKQMCDKPIAVGLWPWAEVSEHWDVIRLRSWIGENELYQDGTVAAMLDPHEIIAGYAPDGLLDGTLMLCGTLGAIGGIRPSHRFTFELDDPHLRRRIGHSYEMTSLEVSK